VRVSKKLAALLLGVVLTSCGSEFNFNSLLVTSAQQEAFDVLVSVAERAYNTGDFELAREKGEAALAINNNNEEVSILLGYIYLSLAGIDTFQLIEKLSDTSESAQGTLALLAGSNAASQLSGLSSIVGVTAADTEKFGTKQVSTSVEFQDFPVIHPTTAAVARASSGVAALLYMDNAIKIICPFVARSVLIADDPATEEDESDVRHTEAACPETTNVKTLTTKANFLWAFSHLTDALSFYNVVMYSTGELALPNIEKRAAAVNSGDISDIAKYVTLVDELAGDIGKIMDTTRESQLTAVLNGLGAASKAFGAMPGVPTSFTSGIDTALESVKSAAGNSGGASATSNLKGQLTEAVATQLNAKMTSLQQSANPNAEEQEQICAAFETLGASATNKPDGC
jgi:hypothetical protein